MTTTTEARILPAPVQRFVTMAESVGWGVSVRDRSVLLTPDEGKPVSGK